MRYVHTHKCITSCLKHIQTICFDFEINHEQDRGRVEMYESIGVSSLATAIRIDPDWAS